MSDNGDQGPWLSYANLSDYYERKARFLPGLLTLLVVIPGLAALGIYCTNVLDKVLSGMGIGAVFGVLISHLASALGNSFQKGLWPRWPYDSPTNRWLHPEDHSRSEQQKAIWYSAIKRLTGIDIEATIQRGDNQELEPTINDAVTRLRYRLRNSKQGDRLGIHNTDYGFARNLTGLRPLWLTLAAVSSAVCWITYFRTDGRVDLCIYSTAILFLTFPLAYRVLPNYVKVKANHYAESFFGAMMELDEEKVRS